MVTKTKAKKVMSKKPNKAELIREFLRTNPNASAKQVQEGVSGVKLSTSQIYGIRRQMKKRRRKTSNKSQAIREFIQANPGRSVEEIYQSLKPQRIQKALIYQVRRNLNNGLPREQDRTEFLSRLLAAKNLADKIGGLDALREAVDTLAKLR